MSDATEPDPGRGRERDLERLLTFLDAIVAIAVTLLVLPLVDLVGRLADGGSVSTLLSEHAADLWSFVLSFYVISRLWVAQHHAVSSLLSDSSRLTTLLLAWAFTIVVLPFPTALVARAGEQPTTKALYVGAMATSQLLLAGVRVEIRRHPELADGSLQTGPSLALTAAGLLLTALVVMLVLPGASYWPILLLLLEGPILRLLLWRRRRRRGPTG